MIRETWQQLGQDPGKAAVKDDILAGEYVVTIDKVKFLENKETLPECLFINFIITTGSLRNRKFSVPQYFRSRKSVLAWRSDIRKILPDAFEVHFDAVLQSLEKISLQKAPLRISLSYNGNGNGKSYLNLRYIGLVQVEDAVPVEKKAVALEPF